MSWFDALIQTIQQGFSDVAGQVQQKIDDAIGGVYGALNYVTGGLTANIYNASNYVGQGITSAYNGITGAIGNATSAIESTIGTIQGNILGRVDGVYNQVYNSAQNVIGAISSNVSSGLANVSGALNSATSTIYNTLNSTAASIGSTIGSVESALSGQINSTLSSIGSALGSVQANLATSIDQGLSSLGTGFGNLVTSLQSNIDSGLSQVGTLVGSVAEGVSASLANLAPDLGAIATAIETGKPILDAIAAIGELVKAGLDSATGNLDLVSQNKSQTYADILSGKYTTPKQIIDALFDPPPTESFATRFMELAGAIVGSIGLFSQVGGILARPWIYDINALHPNLTLSPEILAQGVVQSQFDPANAERAALNSGLSSDYFQFLVRLAGDPPGLGEVLELWRRQFMTEAEVDQALKESRLKNKYNEQVKKLRYVLPPIADVIRMAVREAWDDATASKFGYDNDYPSKVAELAPQLGIDPDWIRRYWRAHWQLPSFSELTEMLHRSPETGVTVDLVDQALRVADVPDFWRSKLIKIAYAPFTRVDIRRMYKLKVLNIAQVTQAYKDIGYNDERAKALADFTVKLEDAQGFLNPDVLERQVYSATSALFVRGKRSESDLTSTMQKFGWGQEAIDLELQVAKLKQEAWTKVDSKDASGLTAVTLQRQIVERTIDLYVRNQGSLGDVSALMNEYGWGQDIQDLVLKRATLDKLFDAAPTQKQQLRDLSQSAILEAYAAHTFTVDETKTRLVAIGLAADDAQTLIDIKDYTEATAQRTKIVAALRSAFLGNRLSEADAVAALMQFGFAQTEAANYLTLWSLDKSLQHKDFTEAQLASFLKHGVITVDAYAAQLASLGWSTDQIEIWKAYRGADATVT